MGKASRKVKATSIQSPTRALDKKLSRVIRRLGLIDSRCSQETFYRNAEIALGIDDMAAWLGISASSSYEENYDFHYSTLERAIVTSVSWRSWPLEVELRWLLPRLAESLSAVHQDRRYLVEIGAGPGAAAAIVSAVLEVPVLATDRHPMTQGLAEQFSNRVNGDASSFVVDALDIDSVFRDAPPAAVFGMGVFRYVVPHNHGSRVFSYLNSASGFMKEEPSNVAVKFFESIAPADLFLAEQMCEDYLGEVGAAALASDYFFASKGVERLFHQLPGEESNCVCVHLTQNDDAKTLKSPIEELAGALPVLKAGLKAEGLQAEVLRAQIGPTDQLELEEFTWEDGSGILRREFFRTADFFGSYRASNIGFRELRLARLANEQVLREEMEGEEVRDITGSSVSRRSISTPSAFW